MKSGLASAFVIGFTFFCIVSFPARSWAQATITTDKGFTEDFDVL
jgi:hypothetical protein